MAKGNKACFRSGSSLYRRVNTTQCSPTDATIFHTANRNIRKQMKKKHQSGIVSQEEEWNVDKFSLMCISMVPGCKKRDSNSPSKTDERDKAKETSEAGTELPSMVHSSIRNQA